MFTDIQGIVRRRTLMLDMGYVWYKAYAWCAHAGPACAHQEGWLGTPTSLLLYDSI